MRKFKLNRLKVLFTISVFTASLSLAVAQDNIVIPDLGPAGIRGMTVQAEKNYGEFFMRKANGAGAVTADPVLNEYIDTVGSKLIMNASNVYFPFEFFSLQIRV